MSQFTIASLSENYGKTGLKCLKIQSLTPSHTGVVEQEGIVYDVIEYLKSFKNVKPFDNRAFCSDTGYFSSESCDERDEMAGIAITRPTPKIAKCNPPNVAILCTRNIVTLFGQYFKPVNINLSVYCKAGNVVRRAIYIPANENPPKTKWSSYYCSAHDDTTCSMSELLQVAENDQNTVFIPIFSEAHQIAKDLFRMKQDFHTLFNTKKGLIPFVLFTKKFCEKFEEKLPRNGTLFRSGERSLQALWTETVNNDLTRIQTLVIPTATGRSQTDNVLQTLFGPSNQRVDETYNVSWVTKNSHILLAKVLKGEASVRVGGKDCSKLEVTITKGCAEVELLVWETGEPEIGHDYDGDKYKFPFPFSRPCVTFKEDAKEGNNEGYEVVGRQGTPMNVKPFTEENISTYESLFESVINLRKECDWEKWAPVIAAIWQEKGILQFTSHVRKYNHGIMKDAMQNIELMIPFQSGSSDPLHPPCLSRSGHFPTLARATSQTV